MVERAGPGWTGVPLSPEAASHARPPQGSEPALGDLRATAHAAASEAAVLFKNFSDNDEALQSVATAGAILIECLERGGKVLTCGNGGSMCDAMHLAEELTGRFRADRPAYAALALSDVGHLTCVGNDVGFDEVFARSIEALGRPGDVLVAFTTSGTSPNMLRAASTARSRQMAVIAVTGHHGRPIEGDATLTVVTPGGRWSDRIQELHSLVIHMLVELIERSLVRQEVP